MLGLGENDDLVEVNIVQKLDELSDFLGLLELDEVLLQAVKGQLGLLVDEELLWVLHVHPADVFGLGGKGGGEHHHLSVGRVALHEDLLHLGSHVCRINH